MEKERQKKKRWALRTTVCCGLHSSNIFTVSSFVPEHSGDFWFHLKNVLIYDGRLRHYIHRRRFYQRTPNKKKLTKRYATMNLQNGLGLVTDNTFIQT